MKVKIREQYCKEKGIGVVTNINSYVDWLERKLSPTVDKGVSDEDDLIEVCVVELSDCELQVWTKAELEKAYKDAEEFDGFIGWIERANGVMQKKHIKHLSSHPTPKPQEKFIDMKTSLKILKTIADALNIESR